jgi:AraC family transcriptional regulator, regulatory protein of adaptative response / methylated-DNA-[protein]-cysteine methyltransferase
MTDTQRYDAIIRRDASYDGQFVFGVRTTGVFCRPSCTSRRPLERNVAFYPDAARALAEGFRPCLRCRPETKAAVDEPIVRACKLIDEADEPIALDRLAELVGRSPGHLHRTFTRTIGMSPRRYASLRREDRLRQLLQAAPSVTAAIYDSGYGSQATAYDDATRRFGMTPSSVRKRGRGETIHYAIVPTLLGQVLVATTTRGICRVDIGNDEAELTKRLQDAFSSASCVRAEDRLESATSRIIAYLEREGPWPQLPIDVRATAFQMRVWNALRTIAPGKTMQYGELARALGCPTAARAVARAVATNSIALLVPCHRIVPASGGAGGYRWGTQRKEQLLDIERRSA